MSNLNHRFSLALFLGAAILLRVTGASSKDQFGRTCATAAGEFTMLFSEPDTSPNPLGDPRSNHENRHIKITASGDVLTFRAPKKPYLDDLMNGLKKHSTYAKIQAYGCSEVLFIDSENGKMQGRVTLDQVIDRRQ